MDLTGHTKRLRKGTVPTIFPTYPSHLQKTILSDKPHSQKNLVDTEISMNTKIRTSKTANIESCAGSANSQNFSIINQDSESHPQNYRVDTKTSMNTEIRVSDKANIKSCAGSTNSQNSPIINQDSDQLTDRERKVMKKLNKVNKELLSTKKKIKILQQKVRRHNMKMTRDKEIIDMLEQRNSILENNSKILNYPLPLDVSCLITKASENADTLKSQQSPYDDDLRSFALSLYNLSPKAYDFIRAKFNNALPRPRTLRLWKHDTEPGLCNENVDAIIVKVSKK